jgi:hypothetical protein
MTARVLLIALLASARVAAAQVQDLGHRLPGGVGLDAGSQPAPGLYVADRIAWFASDTIHDRRGVTVPIAGLDIDAVGNVFGVAGTLELHGLYLGAAGAVPLVWLSLAADQPRASVDRLGLGDAFVQPVKLGARFGHADAVASYSFFVPTSQGARTGVGRPQWSHQLSAGGTIFFDDRRGWRVSGIASYLHNQRKLGIDITRGDSFQIQGGAGGPVLPWLDLGIAGYALWQVTDDAGSDLPGVLRGARERAYGLGPEVDVTIRALRSRLVVRFEWDLDGEARPVGTILVAGISVLAWRP